MLRLVEVLGGMLVFGRVAAANIATDETQAQVNPGISQFYALFAYVLASGSELDLIEVRALFRHKFLLNRVLIRQVTGVM